MSKRYQPKNEILKSYLDNNEPLHADIGKNVLISVEDVDIVIERVLKSKLSELERENEELRNELKIMFKALQQPCSDCGCG